MSKKAQIKEDKLNDAPPVQVESLDKIERIRDLILGPHLRDITQRFSTLSKNLTRLEGELSRVADELKEQATHVQDSIQSAEKRFADQLKESASSHNEQIGQLDQRISGQIQDFDKQFTARIQALVTDLRDLELTSRSELRQTIGEMDQAKMDRFSLGELFSQLGDGLKASKPEDEIASLLNELQQEIG